MVIYFIRPKGVLVHILCKTKGWALAVDFNNRTRWECKFVYHTLIISHNDLNTLYKNKGINYLISIASKIAIYFTYFRLSQKGSVIFYTQQMAQRPVHFNNTSWWKCECVYIAIFITSLDLILIYIYEKIIQFIRISYKLMVCLPDSDIFHIGFRLNQNGLFTHILYRDKWHNLGYRF